MTDALVLPGRVVLLPCAGLYPKDSQSVRASVQDELRGPRT
jgi:hypothetical protein